MQVKTSELSGVALNWAVAKCEGLDITIGKTEQGSKLTVLTPIDGLWRHFKPSTDWAQGGPIIEREAIEIKPQNFGEYWVALYPQWQTSHRQEGQTPLIAAMRCYVASKLGSPVDIPDELT